MPGARGSSAGHVGAAPPGGAAASRSRPPSAGDAALELPPEPGKTETGRRPSSAPASCPPQSQAPPSSWSSRRGRRCGPLGRGSEGSGAPAPRRQRRAEREGERQASSAARRAGGGPAAPARPWPGSPENASCAPLRPLPTPAPRARGPPELLASPPSSSCGRPAAGCARTRRRRRRRRSPRAGGKGGAGARGPRRLAPGGAQRGM